MGGNKFFDELRDERADYFALGSPISLNHLVERLLHLSRYREDDPYHPLSHGPPLMPYVRAGIPDQDARF